MTVKSAEGGAAQAPTLEEQPRQEVGISHNTDADGSFQSRMMTPAQLFETWVAPEIGSMGEHKGSIITVTGDTNAGKTTWLVAYFLSLASGKDLLNMGIRRRQVCAIFSCENPADVQTRIISEMRKHNITSEDIDGYFYFFPGFKDTSDIIRELRANSLKPDIIGIDTLSAFLATSGAVGDFNVNGPGVALVRQLRVDLEEFGSPTVFFPAHAVKNSEKAEDLVPLGAGTILYEVDGNFGLHKEDKENGIVSLQVVRKLRGNFEGKKLFRIYKRPSPEMQDVDGRVMKIPSIDPVEGEVLGKDKEHALRSLISARTHRSNCARIIVERRRQAGMENKSESTVGKWLDSMRASGLINEDPIRKTLSISEDAEKYLGPVND